MILAESASTSCVSSGSPKVNEKWWFVVQSRAGMEKTAYRSIVKLEFESYLPTFVRVVSHAGRKDVVVRPLFPLYLFVKFSLEEDYGSILRERGVQTILGINRLSGAPRATLAGSRPPAFGRFDDRRPRPLPLPDGFVELLRESARENEGHIELERPLKRLRHGTTVRILDGPFTDFIGLVDKDQKLRVRVLLDILGEETPVTCERDSLEIVPGAGETLSPVRRGAESKTF